MAHDPNGSRACARIVFRNERDVDLWRDAESRARERSRELVPIDVPDTERETTDCPSRAPWFQCRD